MTIIRGSDPAAAAAGAADAADSIKNISTIAMKDKRIEPKFATPRGCM